MGSVRFTVSNSVKMRTHYDNLKVAENAPDELIKAAFRVLSQKYHPDKNPDHGDANRIMQIINDAYAVLGDPIKRRAYDVSLAERRAAETPPAAEQEPRRTEPEQTPQQKPPVNPPCAATRTGPTPPRQARRSNDAPSMPSSGYLKIVGDFIKSNLSLCLMMGLLLMWWLSSRVEDYLSRNNERAQTVEEVPVLDSKETTNQPELIPLTNAQAAFHSRMRKSGGAFPESSSSQKTGVTDQPLTNIDTGIVDSAAGQRIAPRHLDTIAATQGQTPSQQATPRAAKYTRPVFAPNGNAWPSTSGLVGGYSQLANGGLCEITVDNSKNNSDVFVKLFNKGRFTVPVRYFFIKAYSQYTTTKVKPGTYDVRYQDLDTGSIFKTETFQLTETATNSGTSYSTLILTLYKVANGNMQTDEITEADF